MGKISRRTMRPIGLLVFTLAWGVSCALPLVTYAIPQGRTYEMVSPLYKGGYGAGGIMAVAPDGESMVFESRGAFAGAPASSGTGVAEPYVARRGSSGWSTQPISVPATIAPTGTQGIDFSSTLETFIGLATAGANSAQATLESTEEQLVSHSLATSDAPANWVPVGDPLKKLDEKPPIKASYLDGSRDLSHVIIRSGEPEPLLEAAEGAQAQLYELVSSGGTSSLRLVALNDAGELLSRYCPVVLGSEAGKGNTFNAVSGDGEEIFFTADTNQAFRGAPGTDCDATISGTTFPGNPAILYARLGGERTAQVSAPIASTCAQSAPCFTAPQQRADFQGANEAGTKVFFTTAQPLVTGDADNGVDLYMATIGCNGGDAHPCVAAERSVTSLAQVSQSVNLGEPAEVQGVVSVAPDGSRTYFVAHGALGDVPNAAGLLPAHGADNLYVYDNSTSGATPVFVAELCSGPERSGGVKDRECPSGLDENETNDTKLWLFGTPLAQTGGEDGRFLVFSSYARLASKDTDNAQDIYLYDAVTGKLQRVSAGENGYDANGNESGGGVADGNAEIEPAFLGGEGFLIHGLKTRAVSEDGSRVVFLTASPLSPDAINGLTDLYEWHAGVAASEEGTVSLVSSGTAIEPAGPATISPSGRDVFFVTVASVVAQDVDGAPDVYDARLGGGFPVAPAPPQSCSGDACQGSLSNPVPLLVPGSVSQAPGESLSPLRTKAKTKGKPKAKCKRGYGRNKRGKCVKRKKRERNASRRGSIRGGKS
jgi:hypothetical protein